jgi:hypothetical protein
MKFTSTHAHQEGKEVNAMKFTRLLPAALLLIGVVGASATAFSADGVLSKEEVAPGYCHMRFPAMLSSTLNWNQPVLKNSDSGDIVDYYGSCDENPTGDHQVEIQKLERERDHGSRS